MSSLLSIDMGDFTKNLKRLQKQIPEQFIEARREADIVFLTWMNQGSAKVPATPPILTGILRGSSWAFTEGKLTTGADDQTYGGGAITSLVQDTKDTSAFVYNTPYATRQHEEWEAPGGPFSQQAGNVENKWVEKHLKGDRFAYMELIANNVRRLSKNG